MSEMALQDTTKSGPWDKYKATAKPAEAAVEPDKATPPADDKAKPWEKFKPDAQPEYIDEFTGAPWSVRLELARADNPKEAEAVLKKNFGDGNYGQDKSGNWYYKTEAGQKISVRPGGWSGYFGNLATDLIASSSVMEGAVAGFAAGETVFPAGGGIVGAGLGAMGGKSLDEMVKLWRGTYDKSATQLASSLSNEGAINMGLSGVAPIAGRLKNVASGLLRDWMGVTSETKAVGSRVAAPRIVGGELEVPYKQPVNDLAPKEKIDEVNAMATGAAQGARPPISSVAPHAKALEYERLLRNMLTGDPTSERNTVYLLGRFNQMLKASGVPDNEAQAIMKQATERMTALSTRPVGEAALSEMQNKVGAITAHIDSARNAATQILEGQEKTLRKWAGTASPATSKDVADAIIESRRAFGKTMSTAYKTIDALSGGQKVIPVGEIKAAAQNIVDVTPPTSLPPILKQIAGWDTQKQISLEEAHALRTTLRDMTELNNLTPGQNWSMLSRVEHAVDGSIQNLAKSGEGLTKDAAKMLKKTDSEYATGIARYKDLMFNKLVRDVKSGLIPDPEMVAGTILKDGRTDAAKEILSLVDQATKENIAKADIKNVLESVSRLNNRGEMTIDGPALLSVLHDRADIMKTVHKPEFLNDLAHMATELGALNGKIDVNRITSFSSEGIKQALTEAINMQHQLDFAVKSNPLRALLSGSPQAADRAAETIITPKNEAMTQAARNLLGPESPAWQQVMRYAQTKLMKSAIFYTPSLEPRVVGKAIEDELGRYTAKQQEMLFPDGMAEDLKEIAKEARFLFPAATDEFGGSLAAAQIKGHVPFSFHQDVKYATQVVLGWMIDHPVTLRFLTDQMREDPSKTRIALGALSRWIINAKIQGPGRGKPQ